MAGAVSYAHAHLVVHRDLKPTNILVSEARGVRLLDFGAAKLLREEGPGDSDLTRELGPALSPDYASPEQIRGERVTVATDVYSLGVVLYELLTGQRPYRLPRESWAALIEAMRTLEVPLASASTAADPRAGPGAPGRPRRGALQGAPEGPGGALPERPGRSPTTWRDSWPESRCSRRSRAPSNGRGSSSAGTPWP